MPSEPDKPTPGAAAHSATRDWPAYFDAVAGKGPRETLLDALARFDAECAAAPRPDAADPPLAIDLGCGEGRDTVELLNRGWRVLAIDAHPEAFGRLHARPDLTHADRLETRLSEFHEADLPPAGLINASFALPFCPPEHVGELWARILDAVEPGGRFAGQLFGDRDTWAALPDRSHQTREQVEHMLAPLEIELFEVEERDGTDASGFAKHWHIFHVVARKPAAPAPNHNGEAP